MTETQIGKLVWLLLCVVPLMVVAQATGLGLIDPWWNLALGRLMLEQHQLVTHDTFSFTPTVVDAINQQWLAQLAWAAAYWSSGRVGVFLLRALAVAITSICLWSIGRHLGASRRALAAASLLSGALLASNLGVRAQTLAFPIAALSLWLLQRGGRAQWLVVPLTVIWANVHGSFPLAVAFTGAFALGSFLSGARSAAYRYAALMLACAVSTLLTPYGVDVWRYAINMSSNDSLRIAITEWAPTTVQSLTGKSFFIELAAACAIMSFRRPPVPLTWLLLAGGLTVFGLSAVRNVVWVGIVGLPFWAVMLDRAVPMFADHRTRPRVVALIGAALVAVALFALMPGRIQLPTQSASDGVQADQEDALADLSAYLASEPQSPLFHDANWGAYLEAHMPPTQQVFIDTRFEVHPTAVWDDYLAVVSARFDWEAILNQYGIERVAIDTDRTPMIARALDSSESWQRVWHTDRNSEHIVVWQRS